MSEAFDEFVDALDYPVFVVTTCADDDLAGCLVGFATQASIDPPTFLVGLSTDNHTYVVAQRATHLAVHTLSRDQRELARLFGSETGDTVNKFAQCRWHRGPEGLPILDDACAWFAGTIIDRFSMGDHVGHLLRPAAGDAADGAADLMSFANVRALQPGHERS